MTVRHYIKDFKEKGYWRAVKEWIIGFTIMLFILGLISGSSIVTSLEVAFVASVILTCIMLPFGYWYEEYKRKDIMRERLSSSTFKTLIDSGFVMNETWLEGVYKGYFSRTYWTEGNPFAPEGKIGYSVRFLVFFSGNFRQTKEFIENYRLTEQIIWHDQYIEVVVDSGRKRLPSQKDLLQKADRLINLLLMLNLKSGLEPQDEASA